MMTATKLPPAVHAAFTYAEGLGWNVLTVRPGTKLPLTKHGLQDATTSVEQLLGWWEQWPSANVGIRTGIESRLVVLDLDEGGRETLSRLQEQHGQLPDTLSVATPSGGLHHYFAHPGVTIRNSVEKHGPGFDVRADGGYVVAPPSSVKGRPYSWQDMDPWADRHRLAALPAPWVEMLVERRPEPGAFSVPIEPRRTRGYVEAAVVGELRAVAGQGEGGRNQRLFRAAARIGGFVVTGQVNAGRVEAELTAAAIAAGLDEREATRTIRSGFDRARSAA